MQGNSDFICFSDRNSCPSLELPNKLCSLLALVFLWNFHVSNKRKISPCFFSPSSFTMACSFISKFRVHMCFIFWKEVTMTKLSDGASLYFGQSRWVLSCLLNYLYLKEKNWLVVEIRNWVSWNYKLSSSYNLHPHFTLFF